MELENRVRNQLSNRSRAMNLPPLDPSDPRERSANRTRRRNITTIGAGVLITAALGAFWIQNASTGEEDISTVSPANVPEQVSPTDAIRELVTPMVGPPISFTSIEGDLSPGGFATRFNGHTNGLYYVLSTAPGSRWDPQNPGPVPNDTLYTFDGSVWSTSDTTADGRYPGALRPSDDGLVYSLSTHGPAGRELAVGTSADTGQTWDWTPIDLTDQFGADPESWPYYRTVATQGANGDQLVIVERPAGTDVDLVVAAIHNGESDAIDPDIIAGLFSADGGIRWASIESIPCLSSGEGPVDSAPSTTTTVSPNTEAFYFEDECSFVPDDSNTEFLTWEQLGVEPPTTWDMSRHGYLVTQAGDVQNLGPVLTDTERVVQRLEYRNGEYVASIDSTDQDSAEVNEYLQPTVQEYVSSDGNNWVTSGPVKPYVYDDLTSAVVAGASFTIDYGEAFDDQHEIPVEQFEIVRTTPAGTRQSWKLADLTPDADTSELAPTTIRSGEAGILITTNHADHSNGDLVLFSSDGETWSSGTLPKGVDVEHLVMGQDDFMILGYSQDHKENDTPQPVLIGSVG